MANKSPQSVTIERIELTNAQKKIYSLYMTENEPPIEINEDTLVHFALSRGLTLTPSEIHAIKDYNAVRLCLDQAFRYLQRRPHLKKELFRKLQSKKFSAGTIEKASEELNKLGYLNDADFINSYVGDALKQRKTGPLLIKKKLFEKGAPPWIVDDVLQQKFPENLQLRIAVELAKKKTVLLKEKDFLKNKQKLAQFLTGRGFSWQVAGDVVNDIIKTEGDF